MQLLFHVSDYRLIVLKTYQIAYGLQFAKVLFAKLPAVLSYPPNFLLPMFFYYMAFANTP